jgi:hypothetical protein
MIGYGIGITEILIYFITSYGIRHHFAPLQEINGISYYWFMMTILTFIWEFSYISDYDEITQMGQTLIDKNQSVWTNDYDLSYVLPWKLARIFYAEYGAHGDREYLLLNGDWSKAVESSHAIFCGLFSFFTLMLKMAGNSGSFNICLGISMGSQFMNSLLYMVNYWYQCYDVENVNYITTEFPAGHWFLKRAFMYINVFWLVFPAYTMIYYLLFNTDNNINSNIHTNNIKKLDKNINTNNDEKEPLIAKKCKSDSGLFRCCY